MSEPVEQRFVPREQPRDRFRAVAFFCASLVLVLLGGAFVRTVQLQTMPEAELAAFVTERLSTRQREGARGDIVDRRGRLLASTRVGYRVFVDPCKLEPPYGQLIHDLARVTGVPHHEVAERLLPKLELSRRRVETGDSPLRYVSIGGILDDGQYADAIELDHKGVHLETRSVREYPAGEIVANLVGKVGVDHNGLLGIESTRDRDMKPSPGTLTYTRDARGNALWVSNGAFQSSGKGEAVRLSIDLVLQEIAREELERGVLEANAAGGRLVIADPATGEILAMVDHVREMEGLTPFDLKNPPRRDVTDAGSVRFETIKAPGDVPHPAMRRNRCVEDLYEPGSTFKSFVWSVITERGHAKANETIDTHKGLWKTKYGRTVKDVTPKDELSWSDVLVHSSNIGMAQVAERMSFSETRRGLERFGFGLRTGVDLPGESAGLLTSARDWSKYTQTSVAMGYEVGVTPVQMVRAFCAFARDGDDAGTLPTLRLSSSAKDGVDQGVRYRVLEPWVVYLAREAMERVAQAMINRYVNTKDNESPFRYRVFGKSGTAEIVRPDGRGYFRNQHNSSFLGAAPAEAPRLVVLVVIDDPGPERVRNRTHFGSAVAGPVVCRVVERALGYLGVPPETRPAELADAN